MNLAKAILLAGDPSHPPEPAFEGVGGALKELGIDVTCTTDSVGLNKDALAGKDLLVFHRDGIEYPHGRENQPVPWMQPHQEEAIEQFVLNGGGFLALHNSGWGYPWKGGYRRTLGGYYIGHPPRAKFHVEVVHHDHPVTAGVASYDIVDEQHWLHCDFYRVEVLLVSQGQDGRETVSGWAYEYGFGRVVYLPHGHTGEEIGHPAFQRMLKNAARWLLKG